MKNKLNIMRFYASDSDTYVTRCVVVYLSCDAFYSVMRPMCSAQTQQRFSVLTLETHKRHRYIRTKNSQLMLYAKCNSIIQSSSMGGQHCHPANMQLKAERYSVLCLDRLDLEHRRRKFA